MSLARKFLVRALSGVVFITLFSATGAFGDDPPPSWMRQAAAVQVPGYEKDVNAVVLYDETQVVYSPDGNLVTTRNYVVRILNRDGRRYAVARALYLVSAGRVREIDGWMIRPDGTSKTYDKKSVIDLIEDPDDIYNEYRLKVIDGSNEADTGSIFGYRVVSEERPIYYQEKWFAQSNLPSLLSRYSLQVPSGWKASSVTFNHAPVQPTVNGSTYVWEMRDLPPIKREPMGPSVTNLAPWLAINYSSEGGSSTSTKAFSDWTEVARWTTTLYDPQVVVDDAVAAKAQELTANAKTEFDKIRSIAAFVQNLQYISVDIGVGSGNGYRPRPSNLVLSRGYGDCKDKANLMRALLRAIKIEAYPMAIFLGDPTFVREEWASPAQFNHCIIAIRISDSTEATTVIKHAALGRLLIFDATDPYTLLGDLPESLQGSFGLIIAGDRGGLVRMPVTPSEGNLLDRKINVSLTPDGTISGRIVELSKGQNSSAERAALRLLSATDYTKMLEGWLTRGATGARLIKSTPVDNKEEASFRLDVEFSAPNYGQLMNNRLLVFRPMVVGRRNALSLTESSRKHPVVLDSEAIQETVVFALPAGFEVDEMPDPVLLETPFGKFSTRYEVKEGKLIFNRSLTMTRMTVPVDKYNSVREFYSKMRDAEQAPVVLLRK